MARILSFTAAAVILLTLPGCSKKKSDKDVKSGGDMSSEMSSMAYAKEMGVGINLGNTFEAYWADEKNKTSGAAKVGDSPVDFEKCWGAHETTSDCIKGMKDAGFSTLRVPVYWGNMMTDDGTYTINSDYIARVTEVVDTALDEGFYVVVNIHHYDEFLIKHKEKAEVLSAVDVLWKQIAENFCDRSDYLIFEGFNEALGTPMEGTEMSEEEAYSYVNDMNQHFVDAVRATGGNNSERMLIASGYWTNIDKTTAESYKLPDDSAEDRLMVSVHYIDNAMFWTDKVGGSQWKKYSEDQCALLDTAFADKGVPVFVGECTAVYPDERFAANAEVADSSECLSTILNMAADHGFVPVLWTVDGDFYDRVGCTIINESDKAVIKEVAEHISGK